MLYVTTRSSRDAFTASRSLHDAAAPDGGLFIPFRLAPLPAEELERLMQLPFGHCVAEILNLFFSARLSGWDVDFCAGKNLCRVGEMNHRMIISELWHNQQWDFAWVVSRLSARMKNTDPGREVPNDWTILAVRIAAIFGTFAELRRSGINDGSQPLDIAVAADDFSQTAAVWYARFMGLNIGTIVCACSENKNSWDLMNYGQMRTDTVAPDLERLIFLTLGQEEAAQFGKICDAGRPYTLTETQTEQLRQGLFAAVVGKQRINSIIPRVYRTNQYLLDPQTALAFGGVQDYRSHTGEIRPTLLLAEKSPACCAEEVAKAMGMTKQQLLDRFGLG